MRSREGKAAMVSEATPGLNEHLLSVESFAAVARALNEAEVPFIADGRWSVGWIIVREPGWFGSFIVPPDPDAITRALAALAGLGYRPEGPVFPEDYAKLLGPPIIKLGVGQVTFGAGHIKLISETAGQPPIGIIVDWPAKFQSRYDRSPVEEIAAGIPVHVVVADISLLSFGYRDCPQELSSVVELARTWREEGAEGLGGPFSALPGPRGTGSFDDVSYYRLGEACLRFERYVTIVAAMNATGIRYILIGSWNFRWDQLPPLSWNGYVAIRRDVDAARETLAALASLGYTPDPPIEPEEWVDPDGAQRCKYHQDDEDRWRIVHFAPPEDSKEADLAVLAMRPGRFEEDCQRAHIDELVPGMQVLVATFRGMYGSGSALLWCPQDLATISEIHFFVEEMIEEVEVAFPQGGCNR
jgi:hypothetical protein